EAALDIAIYNAKVNSQDIQFILLDILNEKIPEAGWFDVIVSNPPYISHEFSGSEMTGQIRFEPDVALYATGEDPDIFYKKMALTLPSILTSDGSCYLEINEFRSQNIRSYFRNQGWGRIQTRKDLQGKERMLKLNI
ncbi:MAG: hypothetical protein ABIQ02_03710, partial [Saprospiraceae bacterium]